MNYKKYDLDDICIHFINTDKFKSIYISTVLMNEFKKEDLTRNFVLRKLLTTSSKNLKNEVEVTKKVCELYNSGIVISNTNVNNVITTNIDMEVLEDKYTEDGLLENALNYYFDSIFNPNIIDNKFEESNYNLVIDSINSYYDKEKENKDRYANSRAFSFLSEEYLKYNTNGYKEDLKNITRENMVTYYNDLINNAYVNMFIISSFDDEKLIDIIHKNIKGKFNKNNNIFENGIFKDDCNEVIKEEKEDNNQSKIVMIYKIMDITKRERCVILPILNRILGLGNNSKLFKVVREENSLCYDIRSTSYPSESLLVVNAGISYKNKDKTIELIKKEITNIQNGNIKDEELQEAIIFRERNTKQFEDYNDSILYIKEGKVLFDLDDIDERKNNLKTVKLNEIIELSKKLKLNVIYTLKGDNDNE